MENKFLVCIISTLILTGILFSKEILPMIDPYITRTEELRRIRGSLLSLEEIVFILQTSLETWEFISREILNEEIEKFMRLTQEGAPVKIQEIITHLKNEGMGDKTLTKFLLSLINIVESPEELLEGMQFMEGLDYPWEELEKKRTFPLYDPFIQKKIELLNYERLSGYSEDLSEYKENFQKAIEWLLGIKPIPSHEIIEDWEEVKFGVSEATQSFYITGQVNYYAGGFVEAGRSNLFMDQRGAALFLCKFFGTFFENQNLGQEFIARTFQKAEAISKVLGKDKFAAKWAFAYYYKLDKDRDFESTDRYKILLNTFEPFDFQHILDTPQSFLRIESDLDSLREEFILKNSPIWGGGSWTKLLSDFVNLLTEQNWQVWFYEQRGISFSPAQWRQFSQVRLIYDYHTLLSIYIQLRDSLPEEDPLGLREKLEAEIRHIIRILEGG